MSQGDWLKRKDRNPGAWSHGCTKLIRARMSFVHPWLQEFNLPAIEDERGSDVVNEVSCIALENRISKRVARGRIAVCLAA
jgi:hypothetical protein